MNYGGFAVIHSRRRLITYVTIVVVQPITVPIFKADVSEVAPLYKIVLIAIV